MKDMKKNPFSPGFGKVPPIYLERTEAVSKYIDDIGNPNSPYQTTMVYGMRGTGKTAFLTDISQEVSRRDHWIVVNLAMGSPLIPTLIDAIYQKADRPLKNFLRMIDGISISAFGITINTESRREPSGQQYQNLLETMLKKLKEQDVWLLVTIDEVKSTPEIRQFASVYQLMLRENYNISLLMTGLPQYVSELQNDDVLTFLLRAGRITLTPLDLWAVKDSYARAFTGQKRISEDVLLRITKLTEGYAYAFQLLGYYLWEQSGDVIDDRTVDQVLPQYKTDLFRNAYIKMYQSLSDMERAFIRTMAEIGTEASTNEIGTRLEKGKNYISMYRRRLLDTQIVQSPRRGYLKFSLPFFGDFVRQSAVLYGDE